MLRRVLCRSQSTAQDSKPILYLKGELGESPVQLADTFRVVNGDEADGITFPGMAGKIDYVLAGQGQVGAGEVTAVAALLLQGVRDAWRDRAWEDQGRASDHWPVTAVMEI